MMFKSVIALSLLVSVCIALPAIQTPLGREARKQASDALYRAEGDILIPEGRNAIPSDQQRWPGGVIPYVISGSLSQSTANLILRGMSYITTHTNGCITFVPRTTERNYINLVKDDGCYSYIGDINYGPQDVSIGPGCEYIGTVLHELLHAVGFDHEHNRSDRDSYIAVNLQNVEVSQQHNFKKLQPNENRLYNQFDYEGIMIYGEYSFSINGGKTMYDITGQHSLRDPYDKSDLTASDIYRIKQLYQCA